MVQKLIAFYNCSVWKKKKKCSRMILFVLSKTSGNRSNILCSTSCATWTIQSKILVFFCFKISPLRFATKIMKLNRKSYHKIIFVVTYTRSVCRIIVTNLFTLHKHHNIHWRRTLVHFYCFFFQMRLFRNPFNIFFLYYYVSHWNRTLFFYFHKYILRTIRLLWFNHTAYKRTTTIGLWYAYVHV